MQRQGHTLGAITDRYPRRRECWHDCIDTCCGGEGSCGRSAAGCRHIILATTVQDSSTNDDCGKFSNWVEGSGWGTRLAKWHLEVGLERPTTKNIIGNATTVQSKELSAGNEAHIQHVKLYLSSWTDSEISAPPSSPDLDRLYFNAPNSTVNNNIHVACSGGDCGVFHHYVDNVYPNSVGSQYWLCVCITVSVTGEEEAEQAKLQVWLNTMIRAVTANQIVMARWNIILHRDRIYNPIVGNAWVAANL